MQLSTYLLNVQRIWCTQFYKAKITFGMPIFPLSILFWIMYHMDVLKSKLA